MSACWQCGHKLGKTTKMLSLPSESESDDDEDDGDEHNARSGGEVISGKEDLTGDGAHGRDTGSKVRPKKRSSKDTSYTR